VTELDGMSRMHKENGRIDLGVNFNDGEWKDW